MVVNDTTVSWKTGDCTGTALKATVSGLAEGESRFAKVIEERTAWQVAPMDADVGSIPFRGSFPVSS
jgi:hypothetical protein